MSHDTEEFNKLKAAAEQGDAEAQEKLGLCYKNGEAVEENVWEAFKWLSKAAEQGHAGGAYGVAYCYEVGDGVPQDLDEAVKWYAKSAEQGSDCAYDRIEEFAYDGKHEALALVRQMAENGGCWYQNLLGKLYSEGSGVSQDYEEAAKWYRLAAEQGHAGALDALGVCYAQGHGVPQDSAQAFACRQKAAQLGDAEAQYYLGVCFGKGDGVTQDCRKAVEWFRKAASCLKKAEYQLAHCYELGLGVEQDLHEAREWYERAMEGFYDVPEEYTRDLVHTEELDAKGLGDCEQNLSQAFMMRREAARDGDDEAMYHVGECYEKGDGVPQDYARAFDWYHKTALHTVEGYEVPALLKVAEFYEKGLGVDVDLREAKNFYRDASHLGNAQAKEALQRLKDSQQKTDN